MKASRHSSRPKSMIVCGLMSGTSLDGIDAALVRILRGRDGVTVDRLAFAHRAYVPAVRTLILKNSVRATSNVEDLARLNFMLGELSAEAVRNVSRKAGIAMSRIGLVGSHGQTMSHLPEPARFLGRRIRATLQIGDPSVIAAQTGIQVVGDFRVADVALGGQGAPLVPYVDWLLFRSRSRNRIILNIGGIANITLLPAGCLADNVCAFDTGPGNMVVDALMRRLYGREFDSHGRTALAGRVNGRVIVEVMRNGYFRRPLPKSTGREEFGSRFTEAFLKKCRGMRNRDIIATASMVTPVAIFDAVNRYSKGDLRVDDLVVSGGGVKNRFFLKVLRGLFGKEVVKESDELGIPAGEKEAICFAVLAYETIAGRPANLPSVTGARGKVLLGKICRP